MVSSRVSIVISFHIKLIYYVLEHVLDTTFDTTKQWTIDLEKFEVKLLESKTKRTLKKHFSTKSEGSR